MRTALRTVVCAATLLISITPAVAQLTADLLITKSDGQTSEIPGTNVLYTIVVANNGPDDVVGATVADAFPPELTAVIWSCIASVGSTCTASGTGDISDSINLLADGTANYTVSALIVAGATGTVSNTATVTEPGGVTDPAPGNNTATDADTLVPNADLGVVKSDGPDPVTPGSGLTYTLTVTNNGPSNALLVTLSDTLPPGVSFASVTPGAPTCVELSGTVTCNFAALLAGANTVVTIDTTVGGATLGIITNSAAVSSATADSVATNNNASEDTLVELPTSTPTDTPTESPTPTPTETATPTDTATFTETPTVTETPTPGPSDTPTETPTETLTATATETASPGPSETPSSTPTDTSTETPPPTETPTPLPTPTFTPIPATFTATPVPLTGSAGFRRPLVQAQCLSGTTPIPCNANGITFAKGKVKLRRIQRSKTVQSRLIGKVAVLRVFPAQPELEARVIADITYGFDPDADCPLANTQASSVLLAMSRLECKTGGAASTCKGDLALSSLTPVQCTDVGMIIENVRFEVYDIYAPGSPSSLLARDGLKIFGVPTQ